MSGNDPAMPFNAVDFQPNTGAQVIRQQFDGLSKRELFAAMVMQGFAARPEEFKSVEMMGKTSVNWADALIAELSKPPGKEGDQ